MIELWIAGLVKRFGLLTLIVAGILVFYEGVPLANKIPFISRVPYLGPVIEGRVHRYHRTQSELANKLHQQAIDKIAEQTAEAEEAAREANLARSEALSDAIEAKRRADEAENKPAKIETVMVPKVRTVTVEGQCKKEEVYVPPTRRSCLRYMPGPGILRQLR